MSKVARRSVPVVAAAAGLGLVIPFAGVAGAASTPRTVFVSPTGHAGAQDRTCASAAFSMIQSAVDAVRSGGNVVVCPGTYHESVTITKPLTLRGARDADDEVVDASGGPYGIGIAAPHVTVERLTVENANSTANGAPADGILTAGFVGGTPTPANGATIRYTITRGNLGAGIDVNSSSGTSVFGNRSVDNGIGINVSNDLGAPAAHNWIGGNVANDNAGGCGIVLADHSGAGVYGNVVIRNVADRNGLGTPSAPDASSGSGLILAGGSNASVHDNTVVGNTFDGNGHGGIALHAHAPGANFSGNVLAGNRIGTNNLRTDYADTATTGIYLADVSPLSITVVGNLIHDDQIGIFTAGAVTVRGAHSNHFVRVTTPFGSTAVYAG